MSSTASVWRWRLLALFIVLLGAFGCVASWASRSLVVTFLAQHELADAGVRCDALWVDVGWFFTSADIAPTSCVLDGSPVARVAWSAPISLELAGRQVVAVRTPSLLVERHPDDADRASQSVPSASFAQSPERVGAIVLAAAFLARQGSPSLDVDTIEVRSATRTEPDFTLQAVHADRRAAGAPLVATLGSIALPPTEGLFGIRIAATMRDVHLVAMPTRGELEGTVDAGVRLPILGNVGANQRLAIVVDGIGTDTRWNVEMR